MGRLFGARLARQAGEVVGKRILEAVAFAKGERKSHFDLAPPELPQGARERAAALAAEIDRSPYGNGLGRTLADRVLAGSCPEHLSRGCAYLRRLLSSSRMRLWMKSRGDMD
jgi:hypothetical protein